MTEIEARQGNSLCDPHPIFLESFSAVINSKDRRFDLIAQQMRLIGDNSALSGLISSTSKELLERNLRINGFFEGVAFMHYILMQNAIGGYPRISQKTVEEFRDRDRSVIFYSGEFPNLMNWVTKSCNQHSESPITYRSGLMTTFGLAHKELAPLKKIYFAIFKKK